jgi:DNA-binding NarL/FixJ family response regulator
MPETEAAHSFFKAMDAEVPSRAASNRTHLTDELPLFRAKTFMRTDFLREPAFPAGNFPLTRKAPKEVQWSESQPRDIPRPSNAAPGDPMKPRVIIADDHALVAEGVTKLLEHDVQLVATVADGRALVQAVEKHNPELALVDISLPLLNGLDACRQLKKSNPSVKVIILTMHLEKHFVTEAFRAGVSGYVLKQSVTDELLFAIKEVLKGRTYVSPLVTQSLVDQALQPAPAAPAVEPVAPPGNLSLRQREVLQLVAEGKSTKEIASTLNVSIKTVEFHKTRIMKELKLHSTAELTKHAIAIGLVSVNEAVTSNAPRA